MFYSIYIEGKKIPKESNMSNKNYVYDITSLDELLEDYVMPYLKKEEFIFNGHKVSNNDISVFLIKESEKSIALITKEIEKKLEAENKFGFAFKSFSFENDEYTKDITKEILKKAKTMNNDKNNTQTNKITNKVFIVHGRDESLKNEVARFIEQLDLEAVILHEQVNKGKTIIEKFEENSSEIGYAIILYTPCDKGCLKDQNEFKLRARQNVIFEHGYFIGKLGRGKVSAIVKGELETPSDILGIVYIQYSENWKINLAKELKASGLSIDMNKLF